MTSVDNGSSAQLVAEKVRDFRRFKAALFGMYEQQQARLVRKVNSHTDGTTWGYRLVLDSAQSKATGSSIGEDEIRIFYDICQLVQPKTTYVIGNAFGFSTMCLATAWPEGKVVAIDNWSEGEFGQRARELTLKLIEENRLGDRVMIHTGSSPGDTPAALARLGAEVPLTMVLIDGLHTEEAGRADFAAVRSHLREDSVVFWHSLVGFEHSYASLGGALFDQHRVLRTHGPLGIFYNSRRHPLLHTYLEDACLFWDDWQTTVRLVPMRACIPELERVMRSVPFRAFRKARRMLAGAQ